MPSSSPPESSASSSARPIRPANLPPSPVLQPQPTLTAARFEDADVAHLLSLIADMIDRLIAHNDQIPLSSDALTRFHSRSPPAISVLEYLQRIVRYANIEKSCLLITLHYIDLICTRLPRFTITSLTVHRFLISSVTVSSKALCDVFCTNSHYARVGGVRLPELNMLEREFLRAIDWRLTCTRELLQSYYVNLVRTNSKGEFEIAGEEPAPEQELAESITENEGSPSADVVDEGDDTATHPSSASAQGDDGDVIFSASSTPSSSDDEDVGLAEAPSTFRSPAPPPVSTPTAALVATSPISTPRSAKRDSTHVMDLSIDNRPTGRRRLDELGNPTS